MFKIIVCFDNQTELNDINSETLRVSRIPNLNEWIITSKFGSNIVKKVCSVFVDNTESYMIII
jgi:hypothetical protein